MREVLLWACDLPQMNRSLQKAYSFCGFGAFSAHVEVYEMMRARHSLRPALTKRRETLFFRPDGKVQSGGSDDSIPRLLQPKEHGP